MKESTKQKIRRFGWLEFITGILLLMLGVYTFAHPGAALTWFAFLYGIIAVVTGITDIVSCVRMERYTGFAPSVSIISGVLSVMAGVMLIVHPEAGTLVLIMLLPIWFIAHCISRLARASFVRAVAGNFSFWLTIIANAAGIILGCMMIFRPAFSFLTAGFLAGLYLVLAGVDSVAAAFCRSGKP